MIFLARVSPVHRLKQSTLGDSQALKIFVLNGRKKIKQFSDVPHSGRLNKNKKNRPSSGHFLLIKNNTDIIETRRSYKNLTNRIHEQWEPSNHDLNTGIYQRGKKTPDPNASVDSWLTFSGSQTEEAEGIVDAFAGNILWAST